MFRLLLIRHAKSSWKEPTLADIDRPLNTRGKRDVPEMARRLQKAAENIELVVSSPAVRAQEIAKSVATVVHAPLEVIEGFYTFSLNALLRALSELPSVYTRIAVVGHNPAITEVANYLAGESIINIPTSGVVALDCHIDGWSSLQAGSCVMDYFDYPKKLL